MMVLTVLSGTPQQGLVSRLCLCLFIPLTKTDSCQIWWGQSRWKSKPGVKSLLFSRTWSLVRLQVHSACINASRFCLSWFLMAICLCYTSTSSSLLMELCKDKQLQPSPSSVWAQDGLGLMFTFSILASFILLSVCFCSFLLLFKPPWGPTEPTLVCIVSRAGILPCTAEVLGQVSAEQSGWSGSECFWPSSSPPRCRTAHPPPLPAVRSRHTSSAAYTNTSKRPLESSKSPSSSSIKFVLSRLFHSEPKIHCTDVTISAISFVMIFLDSEASFALNFGVNFFGISEPRCSL